ncbi:energy transducer TonB [Adhaeribacter sp. BT258]|uniref:Energy transducer TonB n=1 Tax=Adhaeribacter terrigena TaxID=2793070 RepID=A0ABS1BZM0_9BACT|nr:energy transducer TonB [Adhaeribacter terrigena]MBK0402587.1 energy transducer TonB [Adhaeribacter terrigena]
MKSSVVCFAVFAAVFVSACSQKSAPAVSGNSKTEVPASDEVYVMVEEMPRFPGGENEMIRFVNKHMLYPQEARDNGEEGRVIVQFVVTKEGKLTNPEIVRSVSPSIDKEALRIVEIMPLWQPGKQNGRAVNTRYTLPLTFQLQ